MKTHGHVTPNADGTKARCGGPAICSVCAKELAELMQKPKREAQRERLGEVMARAAAEAGGARWDVMDKPIRAAHLRWQLDAIAAAERAGFEWRAKGG